MTIAKINIDDKFARLPSGDYAIGIVAKNLAPSRIANQLMQTFCLIENSPGGGRLPNIYS